MVLKCTSFNLRENVKGNFQFSSGCNFLSPVVPGTVGGMLYVGVFLRYPNPYLLEFGRKPRKSPNSLVDKCDWEFIPTSPVDQF